MAVPERGVIQRAVAAYYAATRAMDVEAWVAVFAPDAVVRNPAGAAPASGHHALRQLWAALSDPLDEVGLTEDRVFVVGAGAAVKWTGRGVGWTGRRVVFEGIDVLDVNDDGTIHSLCSYWDPAALRDVLR